MKKILVILLSVLFVINVFGIDLMAKEAILGSDNYLSFNYEDSLLYQQLDDKGKDVYESLYEACIEFKSHYRYKGVYDESVYKAISAFENDWPEFYWVSRANTIGLEINSFDLDFIYSYGFMFNLDINKKKTYYDMINKGQEIVKGLISVDEYTTVKNIHDYVIDNCEYVNNAPYNQDLRSSLLYGETVCMGYAKMFQFLCKLAGIECYTTIGSCKDIYHAWNYVKVDGSYYWVDCTWDDDTSRYKYFLVNDDVRFDDVQTTDFDYPEVGFINDNIVTNISEYDEAKIIEIIGKDFAQGETHVNLYFATAEDADACYNFLASGVYRQLRKYYKFDDSEYYSITKKSKFVVVELGSE